MIRKSFKSWGLEFKILNTITGKTLLLNESNTTQNADISTVARDKAGRIRWTLPRNTPEENEQLGIRNIQGLFLKHFPEFNNLFPRGEDGRIAEDRREKAKEFILSNIQNANSFFSIFTHSPTSSRIRVPYFNGSHITALQKSFEPWGISIDKVGEQAPRGIWTNPEKIEQEARLFLDNYGGLNHPLLEEHGAVGLRNAISIYPGSIVALREKFEVKNEKYKVSPKHKKEAINLEDNSVEIDKQLEIIVARDSSGRVLWQLSNNTPEEDEQVGIRNIQGLFLEKFPEFNDLFPRGEDGKIAGEQREEAKKFILSKIQNKDDFYTVFGRSASDKRRVPYFNGSHVTAVQKSFEPWGVSIDKWGRRGPKGFWTPERIEKEALGFYKTEGKLSRRSLGKKRSDLEMAIRYHYPGRMKALKEKLGIVTIEPKNKVFNFDPTELSQELRQEILDRFAEFLEENPDTQISVIDFTIDYLKKGNR